MTTNTTRGLSAREALALALRQELGLPQEPTGTAALSCAALVKPTMAMIEEVGAMATRDRQDVVVALYHDADCRKPFSFLLAYRTLPGVTVMEVVSLSPDKDAPMVLLSAVSDRVFACDERGILREQAGRRVRCDQRRTRALRRLFRAAAKAEPSGMSWEAPTFHNMPGGEAGAATTH